ncbi:hypothetical protein X729_28515 [Mesorhizobium sp. L103C131B0]|nr:hypothetical protein X729_28515 [Mesorhizobium sp. L103C131B0]
MTTISKRSNWNPFSAPWSLAGSRVGELAPIPGTSTARPFTSESLGQRILGMLGLQLS